MIPSVYQQRLQVIKKEYQNKINVLNNKFSSQEYYLNKMSELYAEMITISEDGVRD